MIVEREPHMKKVLKVIGWILGVILALALLAVLFFLGKPLLEKTVYRAEGRYSLTDWMADIPDSTSIADLVLPGTHDSAASKVQLAYFARCQQLTIGEQLEVGFRLFDIRLEAEGDKMSLKHGFCGCKSKKGGKLYFDEVLEQMYAFLDAHPTETVVIAVKNEHGDATKEEFAAELKRYIDRNPKRWCLETDAIPTLGELRGRIYFLQRCDAGFGLYIDWSDQGNSDHTERTFALEEHEGYAVCVQDRYHYGADDKWAAFTDNIPTSQLPCLRLDYLSITGAGIPHPFAQAKDLNRRFMNAETVPQAWIFVDFGSAGVAEKIIAANFK